MNKNYNNPPIKEAVFNIRVSGLNISDPEELEKINDKISSDFSEKAEKHILTQSIKFGDEDKSTHQNVSKKLLGFIHANNSRTTQLQVRMDGITLNVLNPYSDWDTHFKLFWDHWLHYKDIFAPKQIEKIGARYINRILVPLPLSKFEDYFTNIPPIPACLPRKFANFLMQIQIPCEEDRGVILTQTIEKDNGNFLPFILDIDAFQYLNVSNSNDALKESFNNIRTLKNRTFEDCITDKTRELFN